MTRDGRRFRAGNDGGEDETVGLAGWMYTDLLLGLAVVFLGSIGFVLAGRDAAAVDAEGLGLPIASTTSTSSTSSTSTTTTTTLPPEECTILYAPAEIPRDGFYITVNGSQPDADLAADFREAVEERLVVENNQLRLVNSSLREFEFDTLEVGIMIVTGAAPSDSPSGREEGRQLARATANRLRDLFPEQFGRAAVRVQNALNRPRGQVETEIFPTITDYCSILSGINS